MSAWDEVAEAWRIRPDTIYLNHGSYGPAPTSVLAARRAYQQQLEAQPMDFYNRHFESLWLAARDRLASFVGCRSSDLAFVENATAGMNVVARSVSLQPGDRVVLNDHEYGAVRRIWQRACDESGATLDVVSLPQPLEDPQQVVESLVGDRVPPCRLLVVSHITSATALILPVAEICRRARERGTMVCVDGPHAPLQVPVELTQLGCDFYTASCHKWLCAPLGSGFLYVAPQWQETIRPMQLSWGRVQPAEPQRWFEELMWTGTRDSSPYLAVPAAIDFFQRLGVERVRETLCRMARRAEGRLQEELRTEPLGRGPGWYGSMAHLPLPPGDSHRLQQRLWERYGIEVPIIGWSGQRFIRVSWHLYNRDEHLDALLIGLRQLLAEE
ncbi:MAG: aminotransferase class V-fold PLP-dependent enzyme [Pirellulales bacterium]